jgi:uncharacterized protein with NAD-binding domain and iron-sulfur cluster
MKKKIVILGGGLGALSAAFELTSRPNWQDRYDIDVYQKGWRLGGKGASGRNASQNQRIEEHGLHCFWGFYDHAFWMMRTAYDALAGKEGFFEGIDQVNRPAFIPLNYVHFMDMRNDDVVVRYKMNFPPNDQRPGMFKPSDVDVSNLGHRIVDAVKDILAKNPDVKKPFDASIADDAVAKLETVKAPWTNAIRLDTFRAPSLHDDAVKLLDKLGKADTTAAALLKAGGTPDEEYRREVIIDAIKVILFSLKGILAGGVPLRLEDFTHFDQWDIAEWLKMQGASDKLCNSQVVRGLYNSSFCFPEGGAKPNLAAGVCLRVLFMMGLTYKGSFMWKMCAAMGDTIFAPLWRVLGDRGVKFHFFHKVKNLGLDKHQSTIESIELEVQAKTKDGKDYDPLVLIDSNGEKLWCWPNQPKYELLAADTPKDVDFESDWAESKGWTPRTLKLGDDFDYVVCGIPVGAMKQVAPELVAASSLWKTMVDTIKTVRTQSVQVWVKRDEQQMHWMDDNHVMTDVYADPFNSIADMYQTLPREPWPAADEPGGVVYFSTAMADDPNEKPKPDPKYPPTQAAVVGESFRKWMNDYERGPFGWLAKGEHLAERSLYVRANIDGDARYVLSVAGSPATRIWPEATGFSNLYIAGDWTKSMLDLGCAENATASGMRAGDALAKVIERGDSPYIEMPGMPVFPPPYKQKDITLCQFVLDSSTSSMQRVLDKYLNPLAGAHKFRALGKWVIFQMGHIGVNNGAEPDTNFGTAPETSATFLVPCGRFDKCLEIGFFAPLILVSHPLSMVAGREVLGMAKQLASFDGAMPDRLDDTIVSTTTSDRKGPSTPIATNPLLRLRRTSASPPSRMGFVKSLFEHAARSRTITFFNARQLRAVGDPSMASSSDLTRGRMRLGRVEIEPFSSGHELVIDRWASHPIAEIFGFSPGPLTPVLSAKIHVDEASLDVEP